LQQDAKHITIYTDGGSRGNPGPAAAGFVLQDSAGKLVLAKGLNLGETTNNVAEYTGLLRALEAAKNIGVTHVSAYSDSELVVRQINGQYKVKSDLIRPIFNKVYDLLGGFEKWKVQHIKRDKNQQADDLVNQAMDLGRDIVVESNTVPPKTKPIRIGVLLSGGGTTLINILEHIKAGTLNAEVPIVISSRSDAKGVERAKSAGLEVEVIRKKDYPDIDSFSNRIEEVLAKAKVDLIVQAGWLCLWKIPDQYENKVMNIHPALLPSFGGQGMWGHHVHEAVIKHGCKISGCTVHFCTNEYDKGPIIVQRSCAVEEADTADTLAARVFEQECIAYPEAIRLFADNRLQVEDNRVIIKQ